MFFIPIYPSYFRYMHHIPVVNSVSSRHRSMPLWRWFLDKNRENWWDVKPSVTSCNHVVRRIFSEKICYICFCKKNNGRVGGEYLDGLQRKDFVFDGGQDADLCGNWFLDTPPKFNMAPEKLWLGDYFPFGKGYFIFPGCILWWSQATRCTQSQDANGEGCRNRVVW